MPVSPFRRLGPLALFAAVVSLGGAAPALAQYNDRYDRPPPAGSDRGYDRDEDDRDAPPQAGRDDRDDRDARDERRYDDRRYDSRDARDDDDRPPSATGRDTSYDAFYEDLEQYGRWQEHPRYGDIWVPEDARSGWRPYTLGSWTYTEEYGWYWTSTEPWGWATYHYGRWAHDDRRGWFWVPGREWAPAWVTWRYSDDLVGWAPLPPDGYGFAYNDDFLTSSRYAPFWIFVAPRYLMTPGLNRYAEPASRNARALSATRLAPAPGGGARGPGRGLDVRTVERLIQRPVTPSRVAVTANRRDPGITRPGGDSITVFKPRGLPQGTGAAAPRAPRAAGSQGMPPPAASPNAAAPSAAPAPGGFDRRRSAPPTAAAPQAAPAAAPPSAAAPSAAPPARHQGAPDSPQRPNRTQPPASQPPAAAPPPASAASPVQPRIINPAPPPAAAPAPRPAPPQAAAPPPRPAPPAAGQGNAPPKEHKQHEHKKDEPPAQPPAK